MALSGPQVFQAAVGLAPRPKYEGKVVAARIYDRWAADLIDYTARPSEESGAHLYRHVLNVQDVCSRLLWAVAMRVKGPENVRRAFEHIVWLGGVPRQLGTDNGVEFRGTFGDYLETEGVEHVGASPRNNNARV